VDRVDEVTKEVFAALSQVREAAAEHRTPPAEILHARMRAFVDRAMRRASEQGFSQPEVQEIGYALAALVDERMMMLSSDVRDYFMPRMLQLQLFNDNVAGEELFRRISVALGDPRRVDLLRVYYLVLLFGFRGKYRVRGGEAELDAVVEAVRKALVTAGVIRDEALSPHGARSGRRVARVRGRAPAVVVGCAALLVAVGVVVSLELRMSARTQALADRIDAAQRAEAER
jgi:type VI secretion system protein ImpK